MIILGALGPLGGGGSKIFFTRQARGPIPGGPGGPYETIRANIAANGATATHFVDFLFFLVIFGPKPKCFCVTETEAWLG